MDWDADDDHQRRLDLSAPLAQVMEDLTGDMLTEVIDQNISDFSFVKPRGRGRKQTEIEIVAIERLTAADIQNLNESTAVVETDISELQRISRRHRQLARLLASGTPHTEAAIICNYRLGRVQILLNDPAFKELMAQYENEIEEKFIDHHENLSELAGEATDLLRERLEDEPDEFSNALLLEISTKGSDRIGHGPSKTVHGNVNVNVDFGNKLEAARQRALESRMKVIEGEVND